MLVLTRKKQEIIQIGDDITITVLRIKGKSVRLGIEAPIHTAVLRGELIGTLQGDTKAQGTGAQGTGAQETGAQETGHSASDTDEETSHCRSSAPLRSFVGVHGTVS